MAKKTDFNETLKGYETSNEWSFNGGKNCFTKELSTVKKLQPAVYRVKDEWLGSGTVPVFSPVNIHSDNISFEDYSDEVKNIIKNIEVFWGSIEKFKKFKILQKLGILFYGSPGTGKTILINYLISKHLEQDGIALIGDGDLTYWGKAISDFRDVEPNRKILFLIEDIDCYIEKNEKVLLNLLDGNHNTNNILFIATTNYPEKLDARLIDRPGRFHWVVELGCPDAERRYSFFMKELRENEFPITHKELEFLVKETEGLSMAHCRNVLNCVLIFENNVVDALKQAKQAKKINNKSVGFVEDTPKKVKAGFSLKEVVGKQDSTDGIGEGTKID